MSDKYMMRTDEDREALGRMLFEEMERLDPSPTEESTWERLRERDRGFYRFAAERFLQTAVYAGFVDVPSNKDTST